MTIEIGICLVLLFGLLLLNFYPRITYKESIDNKIITPRTIIKTSKIDIKLSFKIVGSLIVPLYIFYENGPIDSKLFFLPCILIIIFSIIPVACIVRLYRIYNRKYVVVEDILIKALRHGVDSDDDFNEASKNDSIDQEDIANDYNSIALSSNYDLYLYVFEKFNEYFKRPLLVTDEDIPAVGNPYYIVIYKGLECVFDKKIYNLSDKDELSSYGELKETNYIKVKKQKTVSAKSEKIIDKYSTALKVLYIPYILLPFAFVFFFLSNHTFTKILPIFSLIFCNFCVFVALLLFYLDYRQNNKNTQSYLLYGNVIGIISLIINIILYILFF